ncbi:MAG: class I SAM-dependent methyltransferase [Simkaniaceae bacterium]|nr:class I SAM-dependent methyltransferase [Simkaniaceae bacterium]
MKPHIELTHRLWKEHLKPNDTAIDATCGNGHDALALALLLPQGSLYCIDIQEDAIRSTRQRLANAPFEQKQPTIHFLHQSHEILPPCSPHLIVYNLGYLPGSDKQVKTQGNTTLQSVSKALELLNPGGIISITCYPGHEEGEEEERQLLHWSKNINSLFTVSYTKWPQKPKAPSVLFIHKHLISNSLK